MEQAKISHRFEKLVGRVFEQHDFTVDYNQRIPIKERAGFIYVDLVLKSRSLRTVVEVKTFRTRTPNLSDIRRAAEVLAYARQMLRADHAVLVTSLRRDHLPAMDSLPAEIILVGLDDLLALASGDMELLSELADVERELNSALGDFDRVTNLTPANDPRDVSLLHFRAPTPPPTLSPLPSKGAALAAELREITPGKGKHQTLSTGRAGFNWRLLEQVGHESFVYVFEDVLGGWLEQKTVGGDSNRFDLIAKIKGDDVFCRTLIEDFRSRYILFEFKNYTDPIKANLVYVTEKYLFPTALRSTAIIVSPKGFAPDALQASKGALRDAGKLILDVNIAMLCRLLDAKDQGVTPTLEMEALLDAFLRSLGR